MRQPLAQAVCLTGACSLPQTARKESHNRSHARTRTRTRTRTHPHPQGHSPDGAMWVSSEMKCIADHCPKFGLFPPGHLLSSALYDAKPGAQPVRYFKPAWCVVSLLFSVSVSLHQSLSSVSRSLSLSLSLLFLAPGKRRRRRRRGIVVRDFFVDCCWSV
jgi:hypothetical protein